MGAYSEEEVCDLGECADDGDGHIYAIMGYGEYIYAKAETFQNNLHTTVNDLWTVGLCDLMASTNKVQAAYFNSLGSTVMFEGVNFLRDFKWWGLGSFGDFFAGERWEQVRARGTWAKTIIFVLFSPQSAANSPHRSSRSRSLLRERRFRSSPTLPLQVSITARTS